MDAGFLTDSEISNLNSIMRQCDFNWFEFVEQVGNQQIVDQFYTHHLGGFPQRKLEQIKLSHEAHLADEHLYGEELERTTQEINGETIASKFPNIGQEIERYHSVESCCVGADAWRRTGVRTFDGNKKDVHIRESRNTWKRCTITISHMGQLYNYAWPETGIGCQLNTTGV